MTEPNRSKEASGATQAGPTANREQLPELSQRIGLRPKEAAEALGISDRTLRTWMRNEELPFLRVAGVVLIPREELERWLKQRIEREKRAEALVEEILANL